MYATVSPPTKKAGIKLGRAIGRRGVAVGRPGGPES